MRRRGPKRMRRKGTWLNAMGAHLCSVPLTRNICEQEGAVPFVTDAFLLVDNPSPFIEGEVATVGEATLVRLVGEILLNVAIAGTPTAGVWWMNTIVNMGIAIVDADSTGFVITRSPTLDMENGDWLWKGTYAVSFCGSPGAVFQCSENDLASEGTNANGSHIDLRVKRKLKREESIVLFVEAVQDDIIVAAPQNPVPAWRINGSMRAYVLEP